MEQITSLGKHHINPSERPLQAICQLIKLINFRSDICLAIEFRYHLIVIMIIFHSMCEARMMNDF